MNTIDPWLAVKVFAGFFIVALLLVIISVVIAVKIERTFKDKLKK